MENEIESSYKKAETEKLKKLASEIFGIKDSYRIILLNELRSRGENDFAQDISRLLDDANDIETLIDELSLNGDQSPKLQELKENGFDLKVIEEAKKMRDRMTFPIPERPHESILLVIDSGTNVVNFIYNKQLIDSVSLDDIGPDFHYVINAQFGKIGIRKKNNAHYELTFNDLHSERNVSYPFTVLKFLPHILFLISSGPILDLLFRWSLFAKDPAPPSARIITEVLFFGIYFTSAYLVFKQKYWATWISLAVYSLTTILCFVILNYAGLKLNSAIEVIVRISILLFLLSKIPALISVKNYKMLSQ